MARKSEIRQFYFFEALGKNSHNLLAAVRSQKASIN